MAIQCFIPYNDLEVPKFLLLLEAIEAFPDVNAVVIIGFNSDVASHGGIK